MSTHQDTIEHAKKGFVQATGLLSRALQTTLDERINWSPAPTARTPIQQVAHAAHAIQNLQSILSGRLFEITDMAEADEFFRPQEAQFQTRESVVELLEQNSAKYLQWLEALTPEALEACVELPFGLGTAPLKTALSFAADHTKFHAAQIDYIQTIYGDRIWH